MTTAKIYSLSHKVSFYHQYMGVRVYVCIKKGHHNNNNIRTFQCVVIVAVVACDI